MGAVKRRKRKREGEGNGTAHNMRVGTNDVSFERREAPTSTDGGPPARSPACATRVARPAAVGYNRDGPFSAIV